MLSIVFSLFNMGYHLFGSSSQFHSKQPARKDAEVEHCHTANERHHGTQQRHATSRGGSLSVCSPPVLQGVQDSCQGEQHEGQRPTPGEQCQTPVHPHPCRAERQHTQYNHRNNQRHPPPPRSPPSTREPPPLTQQP